MAHKTLNLDEINESNDTLDITSGGKVHKLNIRKVSYAQMARLKDLQGTEDEKIIATELDKVIDGDITISSLMEDENMSIHAVTAFLNIVVEMIKGEQVQGNLIPQKQEPVVHKGNNG